MGADDRFYQLPAPFAHPFAKSQNLCLWKEDRTTEAAAPVCVGGHCLDLESFTKKGPPAFLSFERGAVGFSRVIPNKVFDLLLHKFNRKFKLLSQAILARIIT